MSQRAEKRRRRISLRRTTEVVQALEKVRSKAACARTRNQALTLFRVTRRLLTAEEAKEIFHLLWDGQYSSRFSGRPEDYDEAMKKVIERIRVRLMWEHPEGR